MTRLALTVPVAGRQFYGLGRDASYAAAERGDIPTIRVGRALRVPVAAVLKQQGVSDSVIERLLRDALTKAESEAGSPSHEPTSDDIPAEGSPSHDGHSPTRQSSVHPLTGL